MSELFTHWFSLPDYQGANGPLELPRVGPAPSFDTLAQSVTRDVHARSLLEALIQLKLVAWDEASDTVRLAAQAFVPRDQWTQMMGFLGDNVGDHLRAAVTNVLGVAANTSSRRCTPTSCPPSPCSRRAGSSATSGAV